MIEYSSRHWWRQIVKVHGTIGPKIFLRLSVFTLWSAVVVILQQRFPILAVPATGHALVGVALGLLLVFRTNTSYERYWEGRKAWERIVNDTRNIVRSARALLSDERGFLDPIVRWSAAYPYACLHSLRRERTLGAAAADLHADDVRAVLAERHVPVAVATRLARLIAATRPSGVFAERAAIAIDSAVRALVDDIGICERIRDTPMPFAYVVHLRRALLLFLVTLPFALVNPFSWSTVLYVGLITYILLGIDEIGVEIEDPFGKDPNDLPLDRTCAAIAEEMKSILNAPSAEVHREPVPAETR